jgi:hypothetical protein
VLREIAWVVFDEVHYMQVRAGACTWAGDACLACWVPTVQVGLPPETVFPH